MADIESIRRLHATGPEPARQPEAERVKSENFSNSQISVSAVTERRVRAQFRLTSSQPEAGYGLDPGQVMAIMNNAGPLDRRHDLAAIEAQNLLASWLSRRVRAQQGGANYQPAGIAISI